MVVNTQNGGINQYVGRDGRNYNNSPIFGEVVEETEENVNITELNESSDPKNLMKEIHRLKALLFDREQEIQKLKRDLADKKKEIKGLKGTKK